MNVVIRVEAIKVWAYIGVYHDEQVQGRYFTIDVEVVADLSEAEILEDKLESVYNYEWIANIVHSEMKIPCALLEKKAIIIANAIKSTDNRLKSVKLKLSKLNPPLEGEIKSSSVEVFI
ncbi:MAG: dihydroneopterin aldolase [Chitinophagales bacterium]|nr:dihydroneopterin aldolase [Chitinophagales bacterium]